MSGVLVAFIRVERRGSHGYRAAITSLNDIQDRVVESGIKLYSFRKCLKHALHTWDLIWLLV